MDADTLVLHDETGDAAPHRLVVLIEQIGGWHEQVQHIGELHADGRQRLIVYCTFTEPRSNLG